MPFAMVTTITHDMFCTPQHSFGFCLQDVRKFAPGSTEDISPIVFTKESTIDFCKIVFNDTVWVKKKGAVNRVYARWVAKSV